jgi:hypothetical protein
MRVSWETIDTEYIPAPGIEYDLGPGCIRKLRRPTYDVMRAFMDAFYRLQSTAKPGDDGYEDDIRMECLAICTEGDPLPDGWAGIDMTIATRAVGDFFTFRIPRPARPPAS